MGADAEPQVRSSAWVCEWEAALESTLKAVSETPLKAMDSRTWDKASIVMRLLEEISDTVRRHSPTVDISDGVGK